MLFHTFPFLVFVVVVFAVYWSLPRHRWRMVWLLAASCAFYMSWNPWLISLIFLSASIDYVVALVMERTERPWRRRLLLTASVTGNLGFLVYFKYANFFLASGHTVLSWLGVSLSQRTLSIVLPLGISFYTFEAISYIVDVYRRRIAAVRNPLDYGLYMLFFPHLIAGPIVRPGEFLPQLLRPKQWNWDRMLVGVQFFLIGFVKKAVLADTLASVVDPVFAAPEQWNTGVSWLAVFSYAAQIYCDFSGYSDMAMGLAYLFGFKLPVNFRQPYLATSPGDFWKRWHISLSRWLQDYLYIPLGGSRHGTWATYRNLLLTMFLAGLWHGASWTFAIWGLYNGVLLSLERAVPLPSWVRSPGWRPAQVAATFLSVALGLIFVRAQSFGDAITVLTRLLTPTAGQVLDPTLTVAILACLAAVLAGHLIGGFADLKKLERRLSAPALATTLATMAVLALLLLPEDGKAFLYFQF
jgi:alginate O-acetyltransferase complex protein AlgI